MANLILNDLNVMKKQGFKTILFWSFITIHPIFYMELNAFFYQSILKLNH